MAMTCLLSSGFGGFMVGLALLWLALGKEREELWEGGREEEWFGVFGGMKANDDGSASSATVSAEPGRTPTLRTCSSN